MNPSIDLSGLSLRGSLRRARGLGFWYHQLSPFTALPISTAPSPRIFVVDDEQAISATLAAILRRSGFEVTAFTNPLECLAAAFHGQPELLASDLMMQGLSGIELAVQMQQVCPDCQILLISGVVGTAHPMVEEMGIIRSSFSPNPWNR